MFAELVNIHYIDSEFISHNETVFVAAQNDRSTPLHLACTQGATEVVKLMLSSFDQVEDIINLTDGACQTPLHRWAFVLILYMYFDKLVFIAFLELYDLQE